MDLQYVINASRSCHEPCCGPKRSRFVNATGVYCDLCQPSKTETVQIFQYMYNPCVEYRHIRHAVPQGMTCLTFVHNRKRVVMVEPFMRHLGNYMCTCCSNIVRQPDQYCSITCMMNDIRARRNERCGESLPHCRKQMHPRQSPWI